MDWYLPSKTLLCLFSSCCILFLANEPGDGHLTSVSLSLYLSDCLSLPVFLYLEGMYSPSIHRINRNIKINFSQFSEIDLKKKKLSFSLSSFNLLCLPLLFDINSKLSRFCLSLYFFVFLCFFSVCNYFPTFLSL